MKKFCRFSLVFLFVSLLLFINYYQTYAQGCGVTASCNFSVTPFVGPTNIGCFGDSSGVLDLAYYSGGTNYPYCFEWHVGSPTGTILSSGTVNGPGALNPPTPAGSGTIDSLPAGDYYLVTYNSAIPSPCKHVKSYTIDQPSSLFAAALSSTSPPSCSGTCLNAATAVGSGGTPPYYFKWSSGDIENSVLTSTTDSLCTGNYTVTITDDAGCDTIIDFFINVSPLPMADAGADQLVCSGAAGVTIGGSPTATAGASPYSYLWSPDAGTLSFDTVANPVATPVSTTTYTVTVTDTNDCEGTDAVVVTVNPAILVSLSQTDIACFGDSTGTAVASASGGSSPYTYLWNSNPPQSNDIAFNLPIGTFTVTITDDSSCTQLDSITITQPTQLTVSISTIAISCNGANDGSATANPSGGSSPYTYLWNTGQLTKTINSLSAGTYCVTVTDAGGCDTNICVTLNNPPAIIPNFAKTNVTCNGLCNGTASVTPSGGTSPYNYTWLPEGYTTASVTGLCPGAKSVTILDASGCSTTQNFTITQPSAIDPNESGTDVSCSGNCDGEVASVPSGGTSPYTFNWDIPATTQTIDSLCAGTYNLTVTDIQGCTKTAAVTIATPSAIAINLVVVDATCPTYCNGYATVTPSGGVSPYSISWSDGSSSSPYDSLCSGSYGVTVTDGTGCSVSQSFSISTPSTLNTNPNQTDLTCNVSADGSACVNPDGGTSPYTYAWSCSGSTANCATGLSAGTCTVTITDFNTCTKTQSFTIIEPSAIITTTTQLNQTCSGFCDGIGNVSASGGTSPYTYQWSSGGTDTTATGLCGGVNIVTVTDDNSCKAVDTVLVSSSVVITITSTIVNEDCNALGCDGTATASASGGIGPYDFLWSNSNFANDTNISTALALCAQTYSITATDATGCESIDSLTMTVADSVLQVTDSTLDVSCNGDCDADIYALVSGGTGPGTYTYSWTGYPDTDSLLETLCPGTYTVLVIDGNQCRDSLDILVTEPAVLSASATGINLSCSGICNGSATASQAGGTSPYSYLWSDGQTTKTATGLCADTFYVTVTDVSGCSDSASVILAEPVALSLTLTSDSVSCNGGNDGSVTANPSGGTSPYGYSWSVAQITQTITGLTAGTYNLTVSDVKGCTISGSANVGEPLGLSLTVTKTDVLCNGNCNGTATANPSGGNTPYTYTWSNTQTSQTATGLCAGGYTVTITDATGCSINGSVTISEPSALAVSTAKTNVTCNGFCDGTSIATASGGTTPYSYSWSNGQSGSAASGLCNGTFTVTSTDAKGCTVTSSVLITQPSAISASPNPISSNCGACDGVAKFIIAGGTPGYTHSWNTVSTSYPLTNVCAAIYVDTIRDVNGCQVIATVPVSNINAPDGATIITADASCFANCNGSAAIVAVSGGTSPYAYEWPDAGTDTVMTGICDGTYILEITDAIGCIRFETFVIGEPDSLEAGLISTNSTCNGLSDGTAISNASGGTGVYTYNWSTGAISSSLSGLAAGTYYLTVTDGNGCVVLDTATISDATALSLTLTVTDVLCNGGNTGSIAASVAGGTSPYSYQWSDAQTTASATGLSTSIYSVTIADANGCSLSDTDTVNESTAITLTSGITDATCGLSDGSVTVTASGGNSPYSYSWFEIGQSGATATALAAGTYSVAINDASLCADTFSIGISNVNGPGTSAAVTNTTCNGDCDGTGTITITSGISPFSYLWVPGNDTTSSVTGLCAGTYTVEVTDGNNCTTVQNVVISEPAGINASFSKINATCNGSADGSVTVTASGGVIPYGYLWSTGSASQFISSLIAGTYSVTITDASGCTVTDSVTISEPPEVTGSASGSTVNCNGDCNGTASVSASGGTPGYAYSWSTGATTSIAASLCAGNYTVTITDANGCSATASANVAEPNAISVTAIVINTTCGNCDGTIAVSVSGGTSPYTRLWSTGATTASIANLCPNIYDFTVTDANGCSSDSNFIINNSDGPIPTLTGDTTSCFNSCDAAATAATTGGTTPYSYLWDDAGSQTTASATGLCDGTYAIYVTDATGCLGIGTTTIAEPSQIVNSITITDADCNTSCNVTASNSVSGGTSPYTYAWSNSQTSSAATGLCTGTVTVTITDLNSCSRTDTIDVDESTTLTVSVAGTNANCFNSCDGLASANVSGGASPYAYLWSDNSIMPVITDLCAATYTVTVTDNNGCIVVDSVTVTEPPVLTATISGTDVNCNGGSDGTATYIVNGGTTPYTYNWSPSGQILSSATGLSEGIHSVTITDANGCTIDSSVVISQPTLINLDSISTTNTACGNSSGTATVFISGGETPYSYLWSDPLSQNTQTADSLLQGAYSVAITYNGFCDTSFSGIVIANTNGPTVLMDSTSTSCNGSCDGTAIANVSGGTTPYTYLWNSNPAQTDSSATGLCAGTYDLTVTDNLGCITLTSVIIGEPILLTAAISGNDISCFGSNDGSASVSAAGGTTPYSYLWNTSDTASSISNLSPGNYCVTITDANGCDTTLCITINEPSALTLTALLNNASCNGTCDGSAIVVITGGTSPYTYLWNNAQTNSSVTGLCDGTYAVTITDANNCTIDTSLMITEPTVLSATFTQNQPACADSNGSMAINVSGGTPFTIGNAYAYLWSNAQITASATGLAAGSYSVTVTDSLGCDSVFLITISNLNGPTVVIDSIDSVSCFGLSDGNIYVTASGVNLPLAFSWTNGQSTEDAVNLFAGADTLTVTDTAGCITIVDTTVSEPPQLTVSPSSSNTTCSTCNGTATANVSGGTGGYSFDWVNPQTTSTVTGLCAGLDSVIVTDENGCTATANTTLIDIPGPTGIVINSTDATCFGNCDGTVDVSITGGTTPFNYQWSDGQTSVSLTGLCAGTDTITVTDANGCTVDSTVTISEPTELVADSIVIKDANCGASNGKIELFVSGCSSSYTYLWSDGSTSSSNNGLSAGVYSVTVTCAPGCSKTFSNLIVGNTNGPNVSTTSADVTCDGLCNGSITTTASGSDTPFTYLWSNGDNTIAPDSLCAGEYFVTVTNSAGCITIASDTVAEPSLLAISASGTNITCNSANDGMVSASVGGGTSPYSYSWSNGATSASITALGPGNYCVTITDANGCSDDTCVTVSEPVALSVILTSTNAVCFGSCNGAATVSVSGGVSPYNYLWSNAQSGSSATSLCSGTHSVTITDATGCTIDSSVTISEPNEILSDSIVVVDATCLAFNGSASIYLSGGTTPYSYLWTNLDITSVSDSLFAGNYSVTVTDSVLCTKTFDNIIINNINGPSVSVTVNDVLCNGDCDGKITATASSGTPPYVFIWSTGDTVTFVTSSSIDSLCTGIFSVTVADFSGCATISTDTVNEPSQLSAAASFVNITCNGASNGTATASATGGVSPYSYAWNTGAVSATVSGLAPGNYCVTITDDNGCTDSACVTISEPSALALSISKTNASCNSVCDGAASVSVTGGTSPYVYSWNDPGSSTSAAVTGLCDGTYSVSVTDSSGCTLVDSAIIAEPTAIVSDSIITTSPLCGDSTGTAIVYVSGGFSPYTYQWDANANNQNTQTATGLEAGAFTVTVTDSTLCSKTFSVNVSNSGAQTVTIVITDVSCGGNCDGTAIALVSGGASPYNFLWSNGISNDTINSLCPGNYSVTVTDAASCIVIATDTVNAGNVLAGTMSVTNILCNGNATGSISVNITGGTTPYTYNWDNGQTGATATGLIAGIYCVTVNDAGGCIFTGCDSVGEPDSALVVSTSSTNVTCFGSCDGSATVSASGGTSPYQFAWSNNDSGINADSLCAASYTVSVTDANGCIAASTVTVQGPTAISLADSITIPTCGSSNGAISITASGGTPSSVGYSYLWDNLQTTSTITGLIAGSYCVTVTDSLGCSANACYTLVTPGSAIATVDSIINPGCNLGCDGKIFISVTGNAPFTYTWSNGDVVQDPDSLCAGSWFVTITDSLGCTTLFDTSLTEPSAINGSFNTTDALCGVCDGLSTITLTGGTSPYTYQWSNNDSGNTADSLCAGNIIVTVTDANSCTATFTTPVSNIGGPDSITFTTINLSCFGSCDGSVSATVFGGTLPYSLLWTNSETTAVISDLCAGNYSLSVTDGQGCLLVADTEVTQPALIDVQFTTTSPACGQSNGSITATISGGTPSLVSGYDLTWSSNVPGGQTSATVTGLGPDIYSVTITDSIGCTALFDTSLSNSDAQVYASVINASCFEKCDGSIVTDSISGTNLPFAYLWIPGGQTDSTLNTLCAGNYILEITDANGCKSFQDYTITEPSEISATFTSTDASCDSCNGAAVINVSGGTSPYDYLWTNNQTTGTANSLCAGVYGADVTDNKGCAATFVTGINNVTAPVVTVSSTNVSCFGACDGSATLSVSGGISPYTYYWVGSSPADTDSVAIGLCAADYFVQVSGSNGCITTAQVTINQPAGLNDSALITPPTCTGNDGVIEVFLSGGTTPYIYDWNNGATTANNSNLSAGIYILMVTDNNGSGCTQIIPYTLNADSAPSLTITGTDVLCNTSCDGSATVTSSGGSSPYTYQWLNASLVPIPGQTGSTATSLCAGTYYAQVTDATSCLSSIAVEIDEPAALDTSLINTTSNKCFGDCQGTATAIISGGTPPYSYLWNDPNTQLTNPVTGLCTGSYIVIVSDNNGCNMLQSVAISQTPQIALDTNSVTDALCFDSNVGAIDLNVTGGTPGYTYIWTGPGTFGAVTEDINGLLPGTYNVVVRDTNSCYATTSIIVDTSITLTMIPHPDTMLCEGFGSILHTGDASGNGTITYNWLEAGSGNTIGTDDTVYITPGIGENIYYIIASINGFCAIRDTFKININSAPIVEAGSGVTIVKGVTATVGGNPTATGGNAPYTYSWLPVEGLEDPTISNPIALPAQTTWYTVTVTTADGCIGFDSVEVTVVPLIEYISGFSPNGDGINETWQIDYVEQFPDIDVEIYNRWGQLLFKSHGYSTPWDGTYNGKPLPIGTYYYVIVLNHPKFPDPITGPVTIVK